MIITFSLFAICFLLTVIEQACLSIACNVARNANLELNKFDEYLNVSEFKTWSKISDFANNEGNDKLKKLVIYHEYILLLRIISFGLFIAALMSFGVSAS